jgi:hypothetical protein
MNFQVRCMELGVEVDVEGSCGQGGKEHITS